MFLSASGKEQIFEFKRVKLQFESGSKDSPFVYKNNKTVSATIQHPRYAKFKDDILRDYAEWANRPLGEFLGTLKQAGDQFYRRFLNKYGDDEYCTFGVSDLSVLPKRGIYAYVADRELKYIGRCKDSMKKRINQGYGKIHPKNCYLDGQSTNCHLNALVARNLDSIELWFCELTPAEIDIAEKELIHAYKPAWNIRR